jgi:predicted nucleotidyltransferase
MSIGCRAQHESVFWASKNYGSLFMERLLSDDLKEFLRFLNEEKVEYLLIGGWAVGYYGYPRLTQDMDVWVEMSARNAARILRSLTRFGFTHGEADAALFLNAGNIVRFGFPPNRIEILNQISGVEFADCVGRKEMADFDGLLVPVIGLEDLIQNKRASGRHKDLADIEGLNRDVVE